MQMHWRSWCIPHWDRVTWILSKSRNLWNLPWAMLNFDSLTVSMRIDDDDFSMTWDTLKFTLLNMHNVTLWVIPLGLAILLRLITAKYHHQLIFPLCKRLWAFTWQVSNFLVCTDFLVIPILFYVIIAAAQLDLGMLREQGWVFDMANGDHESWYKFYSYFGEFRKYTTCPSLVPLWQFPYPRCRGYPVWAAVGDSAYTIRSVSCHPRKPP